MHRFRFRALWATLLAPAALIAADATVEGTLAVGGGGVLLEGDRPAFQQIQQQKKDWLGGVEELRLVREGQDSIFKIDARLMPTESDYRVAGRFEKGENFYAEAGFEQFRVWYDGSSTRFLPTNTSFVLFDEDLSLTRGKIWAEVGMFTANRTLIKLRYDRRTRDGTKNSTLWADTNLVGAPYGTRNVVPSFYDLDEVTSTFTLDVGNDSREEVKWNVGGRYQETTLDNKRWSRRRPFESADRQITTKDETKTDIFAVHGFYLRKVSEKLTISAGAIRTDLDSHLAGSRIYGQSYDPVYDPAYVRRQQRDEGFYNLHGTGEIKQTVLNANAVYVPKQHWSIRTAVRFENLHQETMAEFAETNVISSAGALVADIHDMVSEHKKKYDEFTESVEARYTGRKDWVFSAEGEWVQGTGELDEEFYNHHTHVFTTDRAMDDSRNTQKYSANAKWYPKPGLSFAAQYYFKGKVNDYDAVRDNTTTVDNRYPAYITDQDFETHDFNIRMSWRPAAQLNLVTRYDRQQSKIISVEGGLSKVRSSTYDSHILSQSATWSPTGRLYLTGNINANYDRLETPAYAFAKHGDNNAVTGSLGGGYALSKLDDVYVDYSWFRARNFIDNSATSLPFGADQKQQAGSVTWVRRQSERLVYTMKYGYITHRDVTTGGLNNFDAHVIYGKVQYKF